MPELLYLHLHEQNWPFHSLCPFNHDSTRVRVQDRLKLICISFQQRPFVAFRIENPIEDIHLALLRSLYNVQSAPTVTESLTITTGLSKPSLHGTERTSSA